MEAGPLPLDSRAHGPVLRCCSQATSWLTWLLWVLGEEQTGRLPSALLQQQLLAGLAGSWLFQTLLNEVQKLREWPRISQVAVVRLGLKSQSVSLQGPCPFLLCRWVCRGPIQSLSAPLVMFAVGTWGGVARVTDCPHPLFPSFRGGSPLPLPALRLTSGKALSAWPLITLAHSVSH